MRNSATYTMEDIHHLLPAHLPQFRNKELRIDQMGGLANKTYKVSAESLRSVLFQIYSPTYQRKLICLESVRKFYSLAKDTVSKNLSNKLSLFGAIQKIVGEQSLHFMLACMYIHFSASIYEIMLAYGNSAFLQHMLTFSSLSIRQNQNKDIYSLYINFNYNPFISAMFVSQNIIYFQSRLVYMSFLLEKYKNKRTLGYGKYSQVFQVEDPEGNQFAIKLISKKTIRHQPYLLEYLKVEKQRMMSLKSKYIMDLIQVREDQNYVYFICEYCDGGDLLNYQAKQEKKVFSVKDATKILSQVIHGLFQLHEMGYLHRDIKHQNILVKKDKYDNNMYKLADYGFPIKNRDLLEDVIGFQYYSSPQIFSNDHYSYEVDMWDFGVLFYFMLNMEFPFRLNPHMILEQKRQQLIKQAYSFSYAEAVKKSKKKIQQNCTPEVEDLFKKMFDTDPDKRLTFEQIRRHKLFAEYFKDQDEDLRKRVSIIYGAKIKPIDRVQAFIQNSEFLKFPVQQQIVELESEKIDFLFQSEIELANNLNFLETQEVLALKYNLQKYYVILLRKFIDNLKPEIYQKKYQTKFSNLNWKQFFKQKLFIALKKERKIALHQAEMRIFDTYDLCKASLPAIRKFNPNLKLILEPEVTQQAFEGKFKQSYRTSTRGVYQKVRKEISNGNIYYYLTALISLCHGFNRIMQADEDELQEVFQEFLLQNKKQSKMIDFKELKSWMTRVERQKLKKVFVTFLKTYFGDIPVN